MNYTYGYSDLCEPLSAHLLKITLKNDGRERTLVRKGLDFIHATVRGSIVCYLMHWNAYIFKHSLNV